MQDQYVKEIIKHEKRLRALELEKLCKCDFASDNGQNLAARAVMWEYADKFEEVQKEGVGMVIYGSPGSGKSYAAAQIVNELTDRGYDCMYTSMNVIMTELNTLGLEGRRNLFYKIFSKDLLVLDDLGSEVETSYSNQVFIQIVNTCLAKNIPIIVTTPFREETLLEGGNPKRVMAVTRLLRRNISYTMQMPGERSAQNFQQKQKVEVMVKGAASEQAFAGFEDEEADWPEATVTERRQKKVKQPVLLKRIR